MGVDHECPTIALVQKDLYPQLTPDHQRKLKERNQQIIVLFFLDLQD
jgi:hypothetical protein